MANVTTYSFSQIVQRWVAGAQAASTALLNFTQGSVLLAIAESASAVALWLQGMILTVLGLTRASTSSGADLDSWMADYGLTRLPAVAASGTLTFSRSNTGIQAVVPVGTQASISDGSQIYNVTLDATNPAYSASAGGYVLAVGVGSINIPAQDSVGGSAGNVQASTITVLLGAIPGVDNVTNAAPFTGGLDAEMDAAFRARFILYLQSLNTANLAAVEYAIASVQQGITYTVEQALSYPDLGSKPGYYFVVVDDGTGSPPASLITAVTSAISVVDGCGIQFSVFGPVIITANIAMSIKVASGYSASVVSAAVQTAIANYIASLGLGAQTLAITMLGKVAYDASAGVSLVVDTTTTINGVNADLVTTALNVIHAGTITITVVP